MGRGGKRNTERLREGHKLPQGVRDGDGEWRDFQGTFLRIPVSPVSLGYSEHRDKDVFILVESQGHLLAT